jgi:hypothetical protein
MPRPSQTAALAAGLDGVEPLEPKIKPASYERPIMVLVAPLRPCTYVQRACAIWPRLERRTLSRCHNNPVRLARVIARRTTLSEEAIVALLIEGRN